MNSPEFDNRETWRDAIEGALRHVIACDLTSEDAAGPFVLFADELGAEVASCTYATVNPSFWKTFRGDVPRIGNRPGPTMLFNWPTVKADFADCFHAATALSVHELAHVFDFGSLRGSMVGDAAHEARISETIRAKLATCDESDRDAVKLAALGMCEMRFVRRMIHLADRLACIGWRVPLTYAYPWDESGPWAFTESLRAELDEFRHATIREVDAAPIPMEFSKLWQLKMQSDCSKDE